MISKTQGVILAVGISTIAVAYWGWNSGDAPAPPLEADARTVAVDQLKALSLAIQRYANDGKRLPAAASLKNTGKSALSWRVLLLPYLGENELFEQVNLDEGWDGPHNKSLLSRMPSVFRSPFLGRGEGKTTYFLAVGEDMAFHGDRTMTLEEIGDGPGNTIFVVDADNSRAVYWTQPADYAVDCNAPTMGLRRWPDGWLFALGNGTIQTVDLPPRKVWGMFTANGGEKIEGR